MIRTRTVWILACLLLAACAQQEFQIEEEVFSQERMAHAATLGTIYLTSATTDGDHNCDENPEDCCVAGYHLCTTLELWGGRRIEDTGTGRDTSPYNTDGDVDVFSTTSYDAGCQDWSSITTGRGAPSRYTCSYTTSLSCASQGTVCDQSYAQWCCSR